MARNNKTSSVLRLVGAEINTAKTAVKTKAKSEIKPEIPPETAETPVKIKRPRKYITKKLEKESLIAEVPHNPAFRQTGADEIGYFRRQPNEKLIINVSSYLINEQLGSALERFRVCRCDECCRIITEKATAMMPDAFVHVNSKADEDEAGRLIKELRPEAIRVLTKLCISARGKAYHDKE